MDFDAERCEIINFALRFIYLSCLLQKQIANTRIISQNEQNNQAPHFKCPGTGKARF